MTKNKGVALILSVIILTAVLAIALTAGKVFTDKIKISKSVSDSMKAYYAAESGIEYALWKIKNNEEVDRLCPGWTTVDGADYCLEKTGDSIKAIGKARETRRGIEVEVASAAGAAITKIGTVYFNLTTLTLDAICQANPPYSGSTGFYSIGGIVYLITGGFAPGGSGTGYVQCYSN